MKVHWYTGTLILALIGERTAGLETPLIILHCKLQWGQIHLTVGGKKRIVIVPSGWSREVPASATNIAKDKQVL